MSPYPSSRAVTAGPAVHGDAPRRITPQMQNQIARMVRSSHEHLVLRQVRHLQEVSTASMHAAALSSLADRVPAAPEKSSNAVHFAIAGHIGLDKRVPDARRRVLGFAAYSLGALHQRNCSIHIVAILKADARRGARDYEEHQRTRSAKRDPAAQWIDPDRRSRKRTRAEHSSPPAIATGTGDSAELEATSTAARKSEGA